MSSEVGGYVCFGEMSVSTLLEKNDGTLQLLRKSDVWKHVQAFLPKSSSAFDSNKTLMLAFYHQVYGDCDMVLKSFVNQDHFVNKMVVRISKLVLTRGVNQANQLELQWAAAQGPWPVWTTEDQHFNSMQGAYYLLVNIVEFTSRANGLQNMSWMICTMASRKRGTASASGVTKIGSDHDK